VLFVLANRMTTAANAIYLQSTGPLFVLGLGPWLLKERTRRGDLVFGGAMAIGLSLFFLGREQAVATAPDPSRGNVLAALTGLTWALTITGLRWMGRSQRDRAVATVAGGNVLAALATLPMALPLAGVGWADVLVLLYLGVFQIGLAYYCLTRAIRHVPAFEASAVLLLEPALNPVWAWIVHGERPSALALAGGAIILGATLINTWRQDRPASS
jgi:drug/metabolite transporter (DMT)-like permease